MSDTGKHSGRLALLSVPDDEALAGLDDDGLLEAVVCYERATAALAGLSCRAAGLLAQRRHERALAQAGPDASTATVERETREAEAAVVDEIRLACGLGLSDVVARVRLWRASAARAGHVRGRLAEGGCTWAMARAWQEATTDLSAEVADGIAAIVFGPTRDGAALSMGLFRQRLGRQIAKHRTARQRRDFDLSRRDAFATITPHGTGEITVSGSAERVTAAIERVAGIARALRRMGDTRTQAQLRSDVLLDLVIFGDIPAGVPLAAATTACPAPASPRADATPAATSAPKTAAPPSSSATPTSSEPTTSAAPANSAATSGASPTASTDPGVDPGPHSPADARGSAPRPNPTSWPTGPIRPDSPPSPQWPDAPQGTKSPERPERVEWPDAPQRIQPPERPEGVGWSDSPTWPDSPDAPEWSRSSGWPQWVRSFTGGLPPALLHVTVPLTTLMELPGENPEPGRLPTGDYLPAHIVRDLALAAGSTWKRLVTDPLTGEAIELTTTRYRPPPRLAAAVRLRDGTCRAPAALTPADRCDLDHDTPYAQGGTTCASNLSAKARRPHQHKTSGQWATRQDPDGSITWTTGTGRTYTTYPMQYDPTAPGRLEIKDGVDGAEAGEGPAGFLDPDLDDLAAVIDHAELAEAIDDAEVIDPGLGYPDGESWHPIDYRDQGTTAATRPATRPPGTPPPPPVHAPRPDPGPPPF